MARGRSANLVPIDPATLRVAMDGRTQQWLWKRSGVHFVTICRMLAPTPPEPHYRVRRSTYERMRAALPSLPPPPEPTNGHESGHE